MIKLTQWVIHTIKQLEVELSPHKNNMHLLNFHLNIFHIAKPPAIKSTEAIFSSL